MIIRKLFRFEGAHVVRNCSSERCKKSIHGHSYVVEVFFSSDGLDNGQMILDFGLMKGNIKDFIDSFDHAYTLWNKESDEYKTFIKKYSDRWIELPVSPSAESFALMFLYVIDKFVKATEFNNGEKNVKCTSVRVHETATGYAQAFIEDLRWVKYTLDDIKFSEAIKKDWKDPEMFEKLINYSNDTTGKTPKPFVNEVIEQQIKV